MRRLGFALILLWFVPDPAEAGGFRRHGPRAAEEVPPTPGVPGPRRMVTPNGVVVPAWASRRIESSPVPLQGKSWGRRPWAYPLSTQATPSAYWARIDQLGFGAGPTPGYTNGPGIGNIPSAPIGPDGGPLARQGFRVPVRFPFYRYPLTGRY